MTHEMHSPSLARPSYFTSLQALRGVAALLVVLYHLVDAERIYGRGEELLSGVARLGFAGVDVFFLISGFVLVTISQTIDRTPRDAALFLGRRAARILPMYWLFTTVIIAMMLIVPHTMDSSYFAKSKLASYLLWPQADLPLLQVGWTLTYEDFFYCVIASTIAMVPARSLTWALATWALMVLALQHWVPTAPWAVVVESPLSWEFIAGGIVALYWTRLSERFALPVLALGAAGLLIGALVLSHQGLVEQDQMRRTLVFGSTSALVVLGLARREGAGKWSSPPVARMIGDASYSLYLSHLFVITAMARLWGKSGWNQSVLSHVVFVALCLIVSSAVAVACYRLIERPLVRYLESFVRPKVRPAIA